MKRILPALFVAAFTGAAFAQPAEGYGLTRVEDPLLCPVGTNSVHPNFKWERGRLVRDGWTCQKLYAR